MPTPREAYSNTVERQGEAGVSIRAADFGSAGEMIGRAAQGFGQDVSRTAKVVDEIQTRDAETAAREADNIRTAKRLERLYGDEGGYFNQEGRNAVLDQEKLTADLKAIDDEAALLLSKKPRAREMFDEQTRRRDADDLPRIWKHASNERNKYEDQVDADAMDMAIDSAATALDPVAIDQNIDTVKSIAERVARRKGMTDENTIVQARQSATGKAVAAIAQRMERQSPDEALAFVTLHAGEMDPDDAGKLMDQLAPSAARERAGSDIANFLVVSGESTPRAAIAAEGEPTAAPTALPPEEALAAAQWQQESRGEHTDAKGNLTRSYGGALGISQVMPDTGGDPGYGIKPLRNSSREEYIRFGNDYRRAMLKKYNGNIVLALTAYNYGPGNVDAVIARAGDPTKGEISDAAFLAAIPNDKKGREAKDYAPKILNRTGVSVSGAAGPSAGKPVAVGQEVNLEATINNIRASDRSFVDKEALIAEATRMHGYGKQVKAENESAIRDAAYTAINEMPVDSFTDISKLPLTLRQKLQEHPELYNSMRNMAQTNREAVEATFDKAKKERFDAQLADLEQNLMALSWNNPKLFQSIDFYSSPKWAKMGTAKVTEWMKRQQTSIESGNGKGADHSAIRTQLNRFTTKDVQQDAGKMGLLQQTAITLEERILNDPNRKGKPLSDTEREAIAMQVTTEATYTVNGKTLTGTRADAAAAGAKVSQVNIYTFARAELQKRLGRVPLPREVEDAVQQYRRAQGGQ